jgi:hypothetical protein
MKKLINIKHFKGLFIIIAVSFNTFNIYSQPRIFYTSTSGYPGQDILRSSSLSGENIDTICQGEGSALEIEYNEANDRIYWTSSLLGEKNVIKTAKVDGSDKAIIVRELYNISDIALDTVNSKIYWSYRGYIIQQGYIKRANLDGSNVETILPNIFSASWLDVIPDENKIYWLENQPGEFWRANLDGTGKEKLFTIEGINCPRSIQVDAIGKKIYWINECDRKIQRADIDGNNIEDLTSEIYNLRSIKIDILNKKFYWVDALNICSMNLDGSGYNVIFNSQFQSNFSMALSTKTNTVFWTDDLYHVINKVSLNGANFETIINNSIYDWGCELDIDYSRNHIYWSSVAIGRCNIDGTDGFQVIKDAFSENIAIDNKEGKIFWSRNGILFCANINGSDSKELLTGAFVRGITLDPNGEKIYWTNQEKEGKIKRANFNGSSIEEIVTSGIDSPYSIKIDLQHKKIYWTCTYGSTLIQRSNLDGSNVEDLIIWETEDHPEGTYFALALDVQNNKMYWTESISTYPSYSPGRIRRANLDGTQVETIIDKDLNMLYGIALLTSPTATQLISPVENISVSPSNVNFVWEVCNNVGSYHLQVSSDDSFADILIDKNNLIKNMYVFDNLAEGKYYWRVAAQNIIEKSDWSPVDSFAVEITSSISDQLNSKISFYPNPVSSLGKFTYQVGRSVRIEIYDVTGILIQLHDDADQNGETSIDFTNYGSGIYIYRVIDGDGHIYSGKVLKE